MPGIVGLITRLPREHAVEQLGRMLATIRHDPSYTTGTWIDESSGVYAGWVQHENSFCAEMPLFNEQRDVVLVFSGEEYPDPEVISALRRAGHQLSSNPASYLVHLCESDATFPAGLNGRFQGLAIDKRVERVALFNDRSGLHRLYYNQSDDVFYFAVEAKAILAVRPDLGRLDPRGLAEHLACGCVLENRTLFPDIGVLPPGSAWYFRNGSLERKKTYFYPRTWEQQKPLEPETYYESLRDVFSRNLPRYFSGRNPIGMSVTGGLDTRMIMASWKALPGSVPCYSFAGTYRDSHDVRLGKQVAQTWGQRHAIVEVGAEFLSKFPTYAERAVFFSDGCADVSGSAVLYANTLAREIAPTRMTGNYGSEVIRGSRMFKAVDPLPGLFSADLTDHFALARKTYASTTKAHPVTFAVSQQAPWHNYGLFVLEGTQLTVRSPFLDNDLVRTVYQSPSSCYGAADVCLRLIADGNPELRNIRADRGAGIPGVRGELSRRLSEFSFKAEYAYNHGMPQWLARIDNVLAPLRLDRLFLGRHKYTHFRVWYRDSLSSYVREMLLDSATLSRWFLNRKAVEKLVAMHLSGAGNYTGEIHKLLTLELVHRRLLQQN
jgi:asparagine synthase (glutamine-hydrolysing)